MNEESILNFEIMRFKQKYGIRTYNEKDAKRLIRVALADALSFAALRNKTKYADKADAICQTMYEIIEENIDCKNFKEIFYLLVKSFYSNDVLKVFNQQQGYALKFASMVFKYYYCFDDIRKKYKDEFDNCYLPLDSNTLNWYKSVFGEECDAWSNLETEALKDSKEILKGKNYEMIQERIKDAIEKNKLKYIYKIMNFDGSFNDKEYSPNNRIELEFVMWNQEKYIGGNKK